MDKELLFKARLRERDVELPDVGTVRVRALARGEVMSIKDAGDLDIQEYERKLIALAMIDPALTEDEVRRWQEAAPAGELEPVTSAIAELSGLDQEVAKQAYQRFRARQ